MNTKPNIKSLLILSLVVLLSSNQNIAQNVGIGAESFTPEPSAMLEVKSTDKGFLPPRMTAVQRDGIENPAIGLMIFNVTTNCVEVFIPPVWQTMFCGCTIPETPTAGAHVPSETQIVWNWNVVAGADGYKYNTVNDYSTATDNGTSSTYTQENLDCETEFSIYVWAYNACGNSTNLELTQTTSECPCGLQTVTFTYKGSTVTYGTVESSGKCWLDRNLGATQVADRGDLFQWGRADDGHQTRTSSTTNTLSTTDQPGHGNFILCTNNPYDWRNNNNNNRWNANPIVNNPCPSGWRVPTAAEWNSERASWTGGNNADGAMASPLKLPMTGLRQPDGGIINVSQNGCYWSSTIGGVIGVEGSQELNFSNSSAVLQANVRVRGFAVRCIKD